MAILTMLARHGQDARATRLCVAWQSWPCWADMGKMPVPPDFTLSFLDNSLFSRSRLVGGYQFRLLDHFGSGRRDETKQQRGDADLKGLASPAPPAVERRRPAAITPDHPPLPGFTDGPPPASGAADPEPPTPPPALDPIQQKVWDRLTTRRHADELARDTGLGVADLSRTMMQLELKRLVRRLPGNFYERR